ncbi:MAG: sodium:solute symporter family protein [Dehalococcoidia bacterium]|nr:sodium:solute symporter family protein [Dehalococcoidia bacterium]
MLDIAIILLYLLIMVGIGVYAYRRKKAASPDGFYVANRSGNTKLIAGSLLATIVGASVVVGMAGLGFSRGLSGAWWLLVGTAGLIITGLFLARKVRRSGVYTLPELAEKQYDHRAGLSASVLIVVAWTAVAAAQIVAAGKILAVLLPYDLSLLMIGATLVFVLYTILGGQYSIIRTDFVQFGILAAGILVSVSLVIFHAGGPGELLASLPPGFLSFPTGIGFDWYALLVLLVLTGATYVVGPDIYSRLFSAKNEKVARSSVLTAALITVPLAFGVIFVGMGARVLFPGILPEQAFPMVIQELLPVGVTGLVVAALLAAIMSSADTVLLTMSVILGQNIYRRTVPGAGEKQALIVSRAGVVVLGGLSLLIALRMGGVISSLLLAYTIFTSGLVVPIVAGFYREKLKVNAAGALCAIVGGGGTALAVKMFDLRYFELLGFGVCIVLLFGVSWLTRTSLAESILSRGRISADGDSVAGALMLQDKGKRSHDPDGPL